MYAKLAGFSHEWFLQKTKTSDGKKLVLLITLYSVSKYDTSDRSSPIHYPCMVRPYSPMPKHQLETNVIYREKNTNSQ